MTKFKICHQVVKKKARTHSQTPGFFWYFSHLVPEVLVCCSACECGPTPCECGRARSHIPAPPCTVNHSMATVYGLLCCGVRCALCGGVQTVRVVTMKDPAAARQRLQRRYPYASGTHPSYIYKNGATSGFEMCFASDPSTFGAGGEGGPNQNTSQIQHKEALDPI